MDIKTSSAVFFSPTGTTRKIAKTILTGLNCNTKRYIDCTKPYQRNNSGLKFKDELVLLSTPVYYGRIPETVKEYFSSFRAQNTLAIIVVVYGNRAYEDALLELHDLAVFCGFTPIAAGAFVAEHSYSSSTMPIAEGRPDRKDLIQALQFGDSVQRKIASSNFLLEAPLLQLPGNHPYVSPQNLLRIKEIRKTIPLTPQHISANCRNCGCCFENCPRGAISEEKPEKIDRWKCILCFACIKRCEQGAKRMIEGDFKAAIHSLYKSTQERKTNETFLF